MKVFIGSDHAGFNLKSEIAGKLHEQMPSLEVEDCGCHTDAACDYPVIGELIARRVVEKNALGIVICGTGIGIGIAANKVKGARAAMVSDVTAARLSRAHNNANIVCIGARLIGSEVALDICLAFLGVPFEGGRHQTRVEMISCIEKRS